MPYKWIVVEKKHNNPRQLIDKVFDTKGEAELARRELKEFENTRVKRIVVSSNSVDSTTNNYTESTAVENDKVIDRTPSCKNCWWNLMKRYPESDGHYRAAVIACKYCTKDKPVETEKRRLPAFSNFRPIVSSSAYQNAIDVLQSSDEKTIKFQLSLDIRIKKSESTESSSLEKVSSDDKKRVSSNGKKKVSRNDKRKISSGDKKGVSSDDSLLFDILEESKEELTKKV